ncbi:ABC transporter ATP-binding protein [Corticibacter populi]|uniref:ABC transporter ATP-binding protein n=1 Tax=Corticibacter populi TaxID=1550736 RepID=A0A3M6R0X0_9BURK|nr:ABC transporter ATP-binding protein [Corticibacter populi]RMX08914.1 ABC transporter ATP-binding protein [Corticibacter populi]
MTSRLPQHQQHPPGDEPLQPGKNGPDGPSTAPWPPLPLHPGENVLCALAVDLDSDLHFLPGRLVLGTEALYAWQQGADGWLRTPLDHRHEIRFAEHAGLVTLSLHDADARLAVWHLTQQGSIQAQRLVECFRAHFQQDPQSAIRVQDMSTCAVCGAALPLDDSHCQACSEKELEAPVSSRVLLRLTRFARPYKWLVLLGFVLTLASTAATLVPPYLTIPLMDDILIPSQAGQPVDMGLVRHYLGLLLLSALVAWVLGWSRTYVLSLVSERIGMDLRTTTFNHLMGLSLDYFGRRRTGDLIARIGSETEKINTFLSVNALDFATDVIMIAMTAAILISIDPTLAMAALVPLPFILFLIQRVRARLKIGFERAARVWSQVTNVLADAIPGVRVVKAFAQESREQQRFGDANQNNFQANDRVNRTWALFSPSVSLLTEVGTLVVWAFGIWLVADNNITVGVLTAFIAYIGRFYTRLDAMSRIVNSTQRAAAGAKRIFDILDQVSTVPEPARPVPMNDVHGRISLRNLGFRYGSRSVLRGVNLDIQPGEMIGLVGHSGSGKSTLVNLICRFHDASEGAILCDGVDIRQIGVADYHRHIGLVLQEPFLFFGTVAENIAYGRPDATREQIIAAARAAHAHDFILRLPQGYDSLVGERGQSLSGGERQRISIARALLIDPRILIMDEATSAVDTETEKEIQKALDNLVQGRTTIAVAHRLSTLRKANRLVVMDRGEIVEVGGHQELLDKRGAYWRLYQAQQRKTDGQDEAAAAPPSHGDNGSENRPQAGTAVLAHAEEEST